MAAAPGLTDNAVASIMFQILAHPSDAVDAPAPINIPHRLLRDVRFVLLNHLIQLVSVFAVLLVRTDRFSSHDVSREFSRVS
jgi:hypothetical protein